MSKKGQDNQRGISFQNKVALLYMLDHYKYANFTEIRFEGDNFEDFTLFFTNSINHSTFFYNFEIKNWNTPLSRNEIRKSIKKEVEKGINRYSEKGSFFIVAPSFSEDCKEIESFKEKFFFNSKKNFEETKTLYQKIYGNNPLFNWHKEEVLFLKYVHLVKVESKNIDNMIMDRFFYEDSFFYTADNLDSIISRFLRKITDNSSSGRSLKKREIQSIITKFHQEEAQKSESYSPDNDLGKVTGDIETKLETENEFKKLDQNKYITPISARPKAIFYIADKLKKKQFKLKNIKWFIKKILIKQYYFFQCLELLEKYIKENNLTNEDKDFILEFIFKLYEKSSSGSDLQKSEFNSDSNKRILEFLFKICGYKVSDQFKSKIINFLDNAVPDWQKKELRSYTWDSYTYQDIPGLLINLLHYSKKGLKFIFKKYNFTRFRDSLTEYNRAYYDYIENFINKDFKKNFPLVIENLSNQFKCLYESYGYESDFYKGYEIMGGGYSGSESNYNLHTLPLESILSRCISKFYKKPEDWEYLNYFIYSKIDKENPVFVKRSFIPFLLEQLETSKKNSEDNKFYKALESILKIKKGIPFTEDILVNELNHIHLKIKDSYLKKLIKMILYKYSEEGISYNIFIIQLLFQLIESGKSNFKIYLKKTLLNKAFKKHYIYERTLRLFESKITNQYINRFFNEIKDELDISKSNDLIYRSVILDLQTPPLKKSELFKLFKSSSQKDLNCLASIIEKDLWNTDGSKLLEKVLEILKNHLDLEDFYKKTKKSEYLRKVIIQLIERAISYDTDLSEKIINLYVNDTNLSGESENLHNEVATGNINLSISTMRAHLCFTIDRYIINHNRNLDIKSLKKIEKAFSWVKLLIDLDGSLADKIKGFPKPNYYLRAFAIIPLINLARHETRNKLNNFKPGLGDEIKNLAFVIIEKTKEEIEKNKYTPFELFSKVSHLFEYIKDLNEKEAKQFLSFVENFRIAAADYFFIYYALFREKYFKDKGNFKSKDFKKMLKDICEGKPDELKRSLSFTIYKSVENKEQNSKSNPDFDFFEQVKDYWTLLFDNISKDMFFPLLMTLSFLLENKSYYNKYKEHFFQLINNALENLEKSSDYFLHIDKVVSAMSKNNPDDLVETLFLFLKKGDPTNGYIPFSYEVKQKLIPEISRVKNKISEERIDLVKQELKKYNEKLV